MKKIFFSASLLIVSAFMVSVPVWAFTEIASRPYDDFERPSLGVTEPGNTGKGTEPDDSWVHNPDNFVVYWIQYNGTTNAEIHNGVLTYEVTGDDGWLGFGMTGDYKDNAYDAFSVRIKGAKGGEESGLYFNVNGVFEFKWDNARDPDGNPLPPITTEWNTYTISLEKSGMGATKAQRNILAAGWTDFHINSSGGPLTVYIAEIRQVQTQAFAEPTVPAAAEPTIAPEPTAEPTAEPAAEPTIEPTPGESTPEPTAEPTESPATAPIAEDPDIIYPTTDRPLKNSFLVDDFNRASLLLDSEMEVPPGGEFGGPNTDGSIIYWIQFNDATNPVIEPKDGVLRLETTGSGWYGTATDMAFLDEYNCVAFRIKGTTGTESDFLTFNPDTQGAKPFSELKGPDGQPVPPITTEWQTIVVDFVKSGWKGLADGKEYYQNIHLNTTAALTVYIDEIYFTAVNLADDLPVPTEKPVQTPPPASVSAPVVRPENATTADGVPIFDDAPKTAVETQTAQASKLPLVILLSAVIVGSVTGATILITRKPKQ